MQCNKRPGQFRSRDQRNVAAGFSFIELMVVIVIIGLLSTAVTLGTRHFLDKAKVNRARSDLAVYRSALEAYYAESGEYPSNDQGLTILAGKFVDKLRLDPWQHPYQYAAPGRAGPFEVVCLGSDGRAGGDGVAGDLSTDDEDVASSKSGGTSR